eukprot:TRINITY_DN1725_c0_g3_i3.p1 TRINITY_DN1725_c0_g3~~TRINITY_DN1725_c0_g3_i3.p1  ORF type:complete len:167 (-),score=44.26 TRINITY_DN1725_c0_g3_i3:694-1194(-)
MELITLRTVFYGSFNMAKKFCTRQNIARLFQVKNPVVMDSECEEMKYEEKGGLYYDLEPDVVYTVADEADIEDLEDEDNNEPLRPPPMQQRMEKIQSMQIARREMISEYYVPRHPTLFTLSEDKFVPSFVEAITTGSEHALQSILTKETEDTMIYSLEIFNKDFCE